jgi:hypothetical protein
VVAVIGGPMEVIMVLLLEDAVLGSIPGNINERERLAHFRNGHAPLDARVSLEVRRRSTMRPCFPVCRSIEGSLVSVASSVRPPAITEIPLLFISAKAALPLSSAWRWFLCRIAITIILTCGMALANCSGKFR